MERVTPSMATHAMWLRTHMLHCIVLIVYLIFMGHPGLLEFSGINPTRNMMFSICPLKIN